MKMIRMSSVSSDLIYPEGNIPSSHLSYRLSQLQDHSATGRFMSMKISNDTIGIRSCYLPTCSAVPHPTAPTCSPCIQNSGGKLPWIRVIYKYDREDRDVILIIGYGKYVVRVWRGFDYIRLDLK
jgi:hypothetical protein